jgi:hypothetical protein
MNPNPQSVKRWQFSLGALFVAVAFVALTSSAVKHFVVIGSQDSINPAAAVLAFFGIPIGLCGAFGALRGRLAQWLWCGVGIDIVVMGLIMLALLAQ